MKFHHLKGQREWWAGRKYMFDRMRRKPKCRSPWVSEILGGFCLMTRGGCSGMVGPIFTCGG